MFRDLKDRPGEADPACGLGKVYHDMADYTSSLRYHQLDLSIAEELNITASQGRAYGNIGSVYETLGNFEQAVMYQEQYLSIAAQINDKVAKTNAYSSLGKIFHVNDFFISSKLHVGENVGFL